jgi:hypothetical protein
MPQEPSIKPPQAFWPPGGLKDLGLALALAFSFACLFWSTRQAWLWNDGVIFMEGFEWHRHGLSYHPAYEPLVHLLGYLLPGPWPYPQAHAASWIPGSLALGALYLWLTGLGFRRWISVAAALLLGVSPLVWFHSTTIELHAQHGFWVLLAATVAWRLDWSRPRRAIPLAVLAFWPMPLSHLSTPMLVPGYLALCATAARAQGQRLGSKQLFGLLAPGMLLVGLLSLAISAQRAFGEPVSNGAVRMSQLVLQFQRFEPLSWLAADVWRPLGGSRLLLPLLLALGALTLTRAGSPSAPPQPRLGALAGWWLLPGLTFLSLWGVPNHGGYLIGLLPGLALLAASGLTWIEQQGSRRWAWAVALAVLVASALAGKAELETSAAELEAAGLEERTRAVVAAGGEHPVLISFDPFRQRVGTLLPEIRSLDAFVIYFDGVTKAQPPATLAATLINKFLPLVEAPDNSVWIDLSYRRVAEQNPVVRPYALALDAALAENFRLEPALHPDPDMPLLRLLPGAAQPAGPEESTLVPNPGR